MSDTSTNFAYISGLWQSVTDRGRALVGLRRPAPVNVEALIELARKLLSGRGEASGAATAETLLEGYDSLGETDKRAFLEAPDGARAAEIFARAEPTRQELIRRLNHAPGGTLALVKMRKTLIGA